MLDVGKPIRIFYANLLFHNVTVTVVNGALKVGGKGLKNVSPVYREEIARRAPHLIALLSPPVPEPLQPYMGRMLHVDDVEAAQEIANEMGVTIRPYPANGGWVMLIAPGQKVAS